MYGYLHGLGMRDSSIHQGQAQGDNRIGFTTPAGNTSNHLGEVRGDNLGKRAGHQQVALSGVHNHCFLFPRHIHIVSSSPVQDMRL